MVKHDADWAKAHLRLVHAICLAPEGPRCGEPFAHAWVEQDRNIVIQAGVVDEEHEYYGLNRKQFYAALRVQVVTVYTIEEAWARNMASNHFGPWESSYRALCNRTHTVFRDDDE